MPIVSFIDKKQDIPALEGETILDACLKFKLDYPHGCQNGSCGICAIIVHSENTLDAAGEIERHTLAGFDDPKTRLACRAKIISSTEVSEPLK